MFFFYFSTGAADAFKEAVKAEGSTYEQIAKRIGVSRGTIAKFVSGRALTAELLGKFVNGFPPDHGRKILIGHLNDEVKRAGMDTAKFQIIEKSPHSYVLENLARLLAEDSSRLTDVVTLIDAWEKKIKIDRGPLPYSTSNSACTVPNSPTGRPEESGAKSTASRLLPD